MAFKQWVFSGLSGSIQVIPGHTLARQGIFSREKRKAREEKQSIATRRHGGCSAIMTCLETLRLSSNAKLITISRISLLRLLRFLRPISPYWWLSAV
jgi:hypothetical protein